MNVDPMVFSAAVSEFWRIRDKQAVKQESLGTADQGARSAVTGGKHLDGFIRTITQLMTDVGVSELSVYAKSGRELPGFYRSTKQWDLAVVSDGHLVAAIEVKSQVGPSFGNNLNNRTEESLGSAVDIWTAFREGGFLASPAPWLGYMFLLEDCPESRKPVKVYQPHFQVRPEFVGASYRLRYELLLRRLVLERHYSAACLLVADKSRANCRSNYEEPAADLSAEQFVSSLLRHVRP